MSHPDVALRATGVRHIYLIIIIIIEPQFALGLGGTLQASYCGIMASAADCEVARPGFDPGSENVHVEWKRPNQQRRLLVPSYVGSLCFVLLKTASSLRP